VGQFSGFRMTGERLDIPLFVISELSVGPIVKKDAIVGSWKELDNVHLEGLISVSSFRQQPFTFDFVHKIIVFETPLTLDQRRLEGKPSRLAFNDQRGISLDIFADFLIGAESSQCEIDTGSPGPTVSRRLMVVLGIPKSGKEVRMHQSHTRGGIVESRYETTVPRIALTSWPAIALVRPKVLFSDIIYDCVVGVNFWSGKSVTFDIANRELIVTNFEEHSQ
jgi:hypothetical protein